MDEVSIVIRDFRPIEDQAFIYASWRNAAYYGALERLDDAQAFFKAQNVLIRDILKTATVRIAALQDAPEVILGYSVSTGTNLEFIYVKIEFRMRGISKILCPKGIETVSSPLTKIGTVIAKKKKLKTKENNDGQARSESTGASPGPEKA